MSQGSGSALVWGAMATSASSTFAAWDTYTDDDRLLVFLHWSADAGRLLDHGRGRAVARLREQGTSWTDIGRALGITKQAAQQRYGAAARRPRPLIETLHDALGTERA